MKWIKNNSSKTNFCFDNIDYFTINDSICHLDVMVKNESFLSLW